MWIIQNTDNLTRFLRLMKELKCHCGEFLANIEIDDFDKVLRCNCSLCKRRGAIMSLVKNENFKIIKGNDKLSLYQFHTNVAKHYFCSICGVYTHHNPRSNPSMTGFNIACIDEVDTFNLKDILINDGFNHPLDKK